MGGSLYTHKKKLIIIIIKKEKEPRPKGFTLVICTNDPMKKLLIFKERFRGNFDLSLAQGLYMFVSFN